MSATKQSPPPLPTRVHIAGAKEPPAISGGVPLLPRQNWVQGSTAMSSQSKSRFCSHMGYSGVQVISRPPWIHHHLHAHRCSSGGLWSLG